MKRWGGGGGEKKEGWFPGEGLSLTCFQHLRTLNKMDEFVRGSSTQKYEGNGVKRGMVLGKGIEA